MAYVRSKVPRVHEVNSLLKRIVTRLRLTFFPTAHDKEFARWCADGGDEKARFEYDLNENSLVIDLGGYKGQWASDIYARYNSKMLVIEPSPSFARDIRGRFEKNPKIRVFEIALGAAKRQEVLSLSADGSSVYRNAAQKEVIQVEDVAEFFDAHGICDVDLMKVNIEGGEYELLPRLIDTGLVRRIKNLQIQFHDLGVDSAERMQKIQSGLSRTHAPTYQYRFVWENWRIRG